MIQKPIKIDINRAMVICLRHGIKVYPDVNGYKFNVCVDDNGTITKYEKLVTTNDINTALSKTYKAWAIEIIKKETNAKPSRITNKIKQLKDNAKVTRENQKAMGTRVQTISKG